LADNTRPYLCVRRPGFGQLEAGGRCRDLKIPVDVSPQAEQIRRRRASFPRIFARARVLFLLLVVLRRWGCISSTCNGKGFCWESQEGVLFLVPDFGRRFAL
jgi:hypothetical protein